MAPILKESELVGSATETPVPSSTNGAGESQPKAQPVALEVTVTVNGARAIPGSDKREPFSEVTKTVLVLGTGAVIRLSSPVSPGQLLFLTNERTKKEVVCQVVKSKNYRNVSGYVELEFTETVVGFWGMRFPGDRIGSGGMQPAAVPPALGSAPAPARSEILQPPRQGVEPAAPVADPQRPAPVVKEFAVQPKVESRPVQQQVTPSAPQADPVEQALMIEEILPQTVPPVVPVAPVSKAPAPVRQAPVIPVDPEAPLHSASTPTLAWTPSLPGSTASFDPEVPVLEPFYKQEPVKPVAAVSPLSVSKPAPPVKSAGPAPAPPIVSEATKPAISPAAKSIVAHDPDTEALLQQAARLQDQLSSLLIADTPASAAAPSPSSVPLEKPAPASSNRVDEQQAATKSKTSHVPFSDKEVDLAELLELASTSTAAGPELSAPILTEEFPAPAPTAATPESAEAISLEEISALGSALNALPVGESVEPAPPAKPQPAPEGIKPSKPVPVKPAVPAVKATEKVADAPKQVPIPKIPPKPVKTSLDDTALQVPTWLEPLARNTNSPTSTQELVEREKARRVSQPPRPVEVSKPAVSSSKPKKVPSWAAPLVPHASAPSAPKEPASKKEASKAIDVDALFEDKPTPAASRDAHHKEALAPPPSHSHEHHHEAILAPAVPSHVEHHEDPAAFADSSLSGELHVSESEYMSDTETEGSRKGLLIAVLAVVLVVLAGGAWWYVRQKPAALRAASAPVTSASVPVNPATQPSIPAQVNSSAPPSPVIQPRTETTATRVSPQPRTTPASRNVQPTANPAGNDVAASNAPESEATKKPEINQGHLATPNISQKRASQTVGGADPGLAFGDAQPTASDNLGSGLAVASAQPVAPTAPSAPITIGGDVKAAKLITSVSPVYPPLAKSQHISGDVKVDALIDERGRVTATKVISGPTLLQQAAMDTLKLWRYQPATLDGKPVPMHLTVTLQFRLQ